MTSGRIDELVEHRKTVGGVGHICAGVDRAVESRQVTINLANHGEG